MGQLRNAIRAFSVERLKPPSVLTRLSRLADEVLDTSFATVVFVAIDPAKGICRMSSAGHPPPVVAYPDGTVALLEQARGLPLGTGIPTKYRQETIELPAGTVSLYTDRLVERRDRSIGTAARPAGRDPRHAEDLIGLSTSSTRSSGRAARDDIALSQRASSRAASLRLAARVESMDLVQTP